MPGFSTDSGIPGKLNLYRQSGKKLVFHVITLFLYFNCMSMMNLTLFWPTHTFILCYGWGGLLNHCSKARKLFQNVL